MIRSLSPHLAPLLGSLAVWFAFLIAAIVIVESLSRRGAINLLGGIAIFALFISVAIALIGAFWIRWYRGRRGQASR